MTKKEQYIQNFKDLSFNDKKTIVDDINGYNSTFEDFTVSEDWNDFLYGVKPKDIIRATLNGEVDMGETYLRYLGDGTLQSIAESTLEEEYDNEADEIIDALIENLYDIEDEHNSKIFVKVFEGNADDEEEDDE